MQKIPVNPFRISIEYLPENDFKFDAVYRGPDAKERYEKAEELLVGLKSALNIYEDRTQSKQSGDEAHIIFYGTYMKLDDVEILEKKIKNIFGIA